MQPASLTPLTVGHTPAQIKLSRTLNERLSILFEDAHCLALEKPAGQFSVGTWAPPGELSLETAVRCYLNPADPASVYLGIVHRLDRPTSGVILWAKTDKAARRLAVQFQKRLANKEYWAVVQSKDPGPASLSGATETPGREQHSAYILWHDWLTRADQTGRVSAVERTTRGAREAVTTLCVSRAVSLPEGCCWLKLWPQTGALTSCASRPHGEAHPCLVIPLTVRPGVSSIPIGSLCTRARFRSSIPSRGVNSCCTPACRPGGATRD